MFLSHNLENIVGQRRDADRLLKMSIGVFDGIHAGLGRDARRLFADRVGRNLLAGAMSFLNDRLGYLQRHERWSVNNDFDAISRCLKSRPHGLPRVLGSLDLHR